jgi:hypothetical protein
MSDFEVEEMVQEFMTAADTNGDGHISFADFMVAMHKERNHRRRFSFADLAIKVCPLTAPSFVWRLSDCLISSFLFPLKFKARVKTVAGHTLFYAFLVLTFLVLVSTSTVLFNYFKVQT